MTTNINLELLQADAAEIVKQTVVMTAEIIIRELEE